MKQCNHFWVERKDGYEEQCTAAICLICGEYGCMCKVDSQIRDMPDKWRKRRLKLFHDLAINGNEHELEKE